MPPLHLKNRAQADDVFHSTWPTTVLLRITATAYGSSLFEDSRMQLNSSSTVGLQNLLQIQ